MEWIQACQQFQDRGLPYCLITIAQTAGSAPRHRGARMLVDIHGKSWGTIGGGHLEFQALEQAQVCIQNGQTLFKSYVLGPQLGQCCGGKVDLMFEPGNTHPILTIFFFFYVGQALAALMRHTVFEVRLVDERPGWIENLTDADEIKRFEYTVADIGQLAFVPDRSAAVVMTHSHDLDAQILAKILPHDFFFLGLIGSKTKKHNLFKKLESRGFDPDRIGQIHCPIGQKWPGDRPQEIAISIAGALLSAWYRKSPSD